MKKYMLFCLWISFLSISLHAQHTLWGTATNGGQFGYGYIYRTDSIGNNLIIVHSFDNTHDGKGPGPIMQASNGKLYGMTTSGGLGAVTVSVTPTFTYNTEGGTLFEYDPVLDSFKTLISFNSTNPQYPSGFYNPSFLKLLEASPGVLWCVGITLAMFYVLVFPGNIAQYVNGINAFGLDTDMARLIRLFFQPVLILWSLWSTGALKSIRNSFV